MVSNNKAPHISPPASESPGSESLFKRLAEAHFLKARRTVDQVLLRDSIPLQVDNHH